MHNNKYEVLGEVGEGAYGIVLKCRNKENGEILAIKSFKDTEDENVQKSMIRELKVLKTLKHDNIVQLKECFKKKGKLYLVFEYVDKTLLEIIEQKSNGLDQGIIKEYIYQLCKAVNYVHNLDLIHRDIKPENILIKNDTNVKLCDFGFCRSMPQKGGLLTDYVATRWYRAPELLLGSTNYGKEVDYWAIGCLMGELTDGQPMFPGDNELNQLVLIQKLLGSLPQYQLDIFYSNPRFAGYKFENITKPESLERRYYGKLNKTALNFLKMLLKIDPKERLTGNEILMHPYFDELRQQDPEFQGGGGHTKDKLIKSKKSTSNTHQPKVTQNQDSMNITRTNKFQTSKQNFYVNGENYSKSPPKDHNNMNMSGMMNYPPKGKSNPKKIITLDPNQMQQNNIKTFYNIKNKDDNIYNYNIAVNFENNAKNSEGKKINNNTKINYQNNQNLDVIEEDRSERDDRGNNHINAINHLNIQNSQNVHLNMNNDFDKKINLKGDNNLKTFYGNKFKQPDTGADYYEEEYAGNCNYKNHNSPPKNNINNIMVIKKGDNISNINNMNNLNNLNNISNNISNNMNNLSKMTYHGKNFYNIKEESPDSSRYDIRGNNPNFLPQIPFRNVKGVYQK